MSTKQETDSTNTLNYDQGSKNLYSSLTGAGGKTLLDYINNPFGNPAYNMGLGQSMAGAKQLGQQNINSLTQNMKVSGMSGNSGNAFQQAMMSSIGRSNQSLSSNANIQNVMQALQRQMQATGMGMSFSPLLTGTKGSQTSTQSGLGTWLPQVLSMAAGAAMAPMTGGASLAATAGGAAGSAQSMVPSFSGPSAGFMNTLNNPGFGSMMPSLGGGATSGINPLMFMGGH